MAERGDTLQDLARLCTKRAGCTKKGDSAPKVSPFYMAPLCLFTSTYPASHIPKKPIPIFALFSCLYLLDYVQYIYS